MKINPFTLTYYPGGIKLIFLLLMPCKRYICLILYHFCINLMTMYCLGLPGSVTDFIVKHFNFSYYRGYD